MTTRCIRIISILHPYALHSVSPPSSPTNSFFSMNSSEEMHIDPNATFDPFVTPNPSLTPQPDLDSTITITLGMWNHLINCLSAFETRSNNLERALEALDSSHNTLKNRHNTLEHEYYERATLSLPQRKKQDLVRWLPSRRTRLLLVPTPNLSIPSWVRGIGTPRAHMVQSVHRSPHD